MATVLLPPGTGAGVTGPWVDVWPAAGKFTDMRVSAVPAPTVDNVIIKHAVNGDRAHPILLGNITPGNDDLIVDEPVEQIRARTGASLGNTVAAYVILP